VKVRLVTDTGLAGYHEVDALAVVSKVRESPTDTGLAGYHEVDALAVVSKVRELPTDTGPTALDQAPSFVYYPWTLPR
jgi:hypothetical protein